MLIFFNNFLGEIEVYSCRDNEESMFWTTAVEVILQRGDACSWMCSIVISPVKGTAANEQDTFLHVCISPVC